MRPPRPSHEVVPIGGGVVRVRPAPDDARLALIVPVDSLVAPRPGELDELLGALAARGYRSVRTGALGPTERTGWRRAGFEPIGELHLLRHPLTGSPPRPAPRTRRVRAREWHDLAAVDAAAFPRGERLDAAGVVDACLATRRHRVRAIGRPASAYAVWGLTDSTGFLQRLAVTPDRQRHGLGTALVLDGLRWLRRRGAREVLVNTKLGNDAALALYERLGFALLTQRLVVLGTSLEVRA